MEREQRVAAKAIGRVLRGAALPEALAGEHGEQSKGALVRELAYGTLRFLGQLRAIVRLLAKRPIVDASVDALLWVALYQLVHTQAPAPLVVDSAVHATARLRRTSAQGLVNALLRSFLRRRDSLLAAVAHDPEARFSYPLWWIERVRAEMPERSAEVLDAGNARPPLCLRANVRRIAADDLVAAFAVAGHAGRRVGVAGVIVDKPRAVTTLPGYAEGWFSVQDAGAQLAAPLLGAADGMRVLDACAAPGGKTTHLAELVTTELTAIDIDATRLERVADNLARLGLAARLVAADAADPSAWWDGTAFDRILVDAPCTASGVVRRHPDIKWLRRESDISSFAAQQCRLLEGLWPTLAQGGRLLYSTCSLFRTENSAQVDAFLARHSDARRIRLEAPGAFAMEDGQLLPAAAGAEHNHDGFFYALLHKS